MIVLILDSWTCIETADSAGAEQARVLIQMTVDDWSAHLGIYVSYASWEFASGLTGAKLIEADWVG